MMPITREGKPYIIAIALFATVLSILSFVYSFLLLKIAVLVSWMLFLLVINFFRDPERQTPVDAFSIISPADGKVIEINRVSENSYLYEEVTCVSIFMSIFDVHVNRSPIGGVIDYIKYNPGVYLPAFREKASMDNEQMSIGFLASTQEGNRKELKVMIKLIAGIIARRIVFWKNSHDRIQQGERIGMIKFGSRVEVYLPQALFDISVEKGDRVKAGETVIAKMRPFDRL